MSSSLRLCRSVSALVLTASILGAYASAQAPNPAATATPVPKPKPTPPPVLDKLGIKLIPQPGIAISDGDRAELQTGVTALGKDLTVLRHSLKNKPELLALLPDVQVFHKAVDWALRYNEFYNPKQVGTAKQLLEIANQRLAELKAGKPTWNDISGADGKPTPDGKAKLPAMVVRGYVSKIDGSVQPYGIVLPEDYKPGDKTPRRLDFWAHGRGETLTELDFINQRLTSKGEFTPPGAFVLHLYGRYCNANKFAGEVDLFEALEDARKHYNIDPAKLVIRGFSMGGAAVWQFGTHFADKFAVVQPGAGFAETREFNKVYAEGKTAPTWWEEVLYRWYDATDIVANLSNTTTVAYSGEIDGQKQACDIMIRYARQDAGNANPPAAELNKVNPGDGSPSAAEAKVTGTAPDVEFYHVIGPKTPHKILPEAKPEIEKLIEKGLARHEALPKKVRFTTYSLIYPKMEWVEVLGLQKQWERADVTAEVERDRIIARTKNVSSLRFTLPLDKGAGENSRINMVVIDDQSLPANWKDGSVAFTLTTGAEPRWKSTTTPVNAAASAQKRPALCGPVDHAFMSSFVFVKPSGKPLNDKVGKWAAEELDHATGFWRKVFRGEAPVKADTAISDDDIKNSNLVLWGDPSSNAVLKRIIDKLPLKWTAQELVLVGNQPRSDTDKHGQAPNSDPSGKAGAVREQSVSVRGQKYDATHVAPVLIFPNPLNPTKYVVLNSGPTFREDALLNNSQQIPKLPDWAFIDVNTPPDGKWPGLVLDAGFFDEQWKTPGK